MNLKKTIAIALVSGMVAGSVAMANEHAKATGEAEAPKAENSCKGKTGCKSTKKHAGKHHGAKAAKAEAEAPKTDEAPAHQ